MKNYNIITILMKLKKHCNNNNIIKITKIMQIIHNNSVVSNDESLKEQN